jgi:hypothetical protein
LDAKVLARSPVVKVRKMIRSVLGWVRVRVRVRVFRSV